MAEFKRAPSSGAEGTAEPAAERAAETGLPTLSAFSQDYEVIPGVWMTGLDLLLITLVLLVVVARLILPSRRRRRRRRDEDDTDFSDDGIEIGYSFSRRRNGDSWWDSDGGSDGGDGGGD